MGEGFMSSDGFQRIAYVLLIALVAYVAVTGA
jgi:hypothetical protein